MKNAQSKYKSPAQFNFRHWSRKGFAVFASLGKLVRIATLKTAVSAVMSRKDCGGIGLTIGPGAALVFNGDDDLWPLDEPVRDTLIYSLDCLGTVASNVTVDAAPICKYCMVNPMSLGLWGFLLSFPVYSAIEVLVVLAVVALCAAFCLLHPLFIPKYLLHISAFGLKSNLFLTARHYACIKHHQNDY